MRRHRLNSFEVSPVKQAIENELRVLSNEAQKCNLLYASIIFCVWWRLHTHKASRPIYPKPITWAKIRAYINGSVKPLEIPA